MVNDRLECEREPDVIDAIASGRWPERVESELRDHIHNCTLCADVAEVASALAIEQEASWSESQAVPPAHLVWLRARARARADAARQAARPIAVMQALGFACAAAVISGLIGSVAWWVWSRTELLTALPTLPPGSMDTMGFAVRGILLAVALWLVLAPVAVYLAAADD